MDFTSILILGSDSWGLSWRPEASGKNLDDKREAGWWGWGVGIVYSNALIEKALIKDTIIENNPQADREYLEHEGVKGIQAFSERKEMTGAEFCQC